MKKIELKHLSAYLPYQLKGKFDGDDSIYELTQIIINKYDPNYDDNIDVFAMISDTHHDQQDISMFKPVLRPFTDLHKPINDNTHQIPANVLYRRFDVTDMEFNGNIIDPKYGYEVYEYLISFHFDVFGLIEQGLAIDINTL